MSSEMSGGLLAKSLAESLLQMSLCVSSDESLYIDILCCERGVSDAACYRDENR